MNQMFLGNTVSIDQYLRLLQTSRNSPRHAAGRRKSHRLVSGKQCGGDDLLFFQFFRLRSQTLDLFVHQENCQLTVLLGVALETTRRQPR